MGRKIKIHPNNDNLSIDPLLSISFLLASAAATTAIVSSLCGICSRQKTPPHASSSPKKSTKSSSDLETAATAEATSEIPALPEGTTKVKAEDGPAPEGDSQENSDIPLRPATKKPMLSGTNSCSNYMKKSASARNIASSLSSSLSVKISRTMSAVRDMDYKRKAAKLPKEEDSVWMKTIILGERCKIPDDEDEQNIWDGKGKKIPTYRKSLSSSAAASKYFHGGTR